MVCIFCPQSDTLESWHNDLVHLREKDAHEALFRVCFKVRNLEIDESSREKAKELYD